ncbi:ATP-binding protein [Salisediminibacterium halotolerans]|uniref:ATP-binding protein n=1 Tax=Salisediminibacterium halotolerans TaxID=517425 RepID=UPI000EADD023|nr:ATP-binding protein [Salisediminibacterium halotolerans]RLJ71643.1 phospho-acceptor domain-containing protein [Actinophytocola xinjiangensis]RPE86793.1 phospho-acceptor domain-containing protein [Salisediminibacterium halotolerans]TWG32856.1 phospho-acceptor domain-containing protein [Salisediminibacterium halotolerans]GEL06948.1 sensor histidine kinase [Salisediminibacterium halotolerans]
MKRWQSIRMKVLMFGLLMTFVPLSLISIYYFTDMAQYIEQSSVEQQNLELENLSNDIYRDIEAAQRELELLVSLERTSGEAGVFYDILKNHQAFTEIVWLSEDGQIEERYARYTLNEEADSSRWAEDEQWQEEGNSSFSEVRFDDFGQPYMQITVTDSETNRKAGASLQLQKLIGQVASYRISDQASMYLENQGGQVIAHQDYSQLWQEKDTTDYDNPLIFKTDVEPLDWTLSIEQPENEMLAPLYSMMQQGGLAAAVLIFTGSIISVFAGLSFVKPIEYLQRRINAVKAGEWPERMAVGRQDEFGELTYAFNTMSETIQEKEQWLQQEKERLNIVVNSMDAGLAVIRKDFSIAWMNPTLENWLGRQADVPCFQLFNDRSSPCYSCPLSPETPFDKMDEQLFKTDENGRQRIYRHRVYPLEHTLEENEEALIVMEDITEEKEMEEKLIQTDKLSALGLMASSFAHEVNNPLASVQVYSEDLSDRLSEEGTELIANGEAQHYMNVIRKNIDRCKEITTNLLNFSRKSQWDMRELSVEQVLDESLSLMNYALKKQGTSVEKHCVDNLPHIYGDPLKLSQVFVNLIQNALDAMEEQKNPLLTLALTKGHDGVTITVQDNGSGISAEQIPKLFDPFYTSKPTGKGTGLGLSVCYGIVQQMSGTLTVESEEGKGTTFFVNLPA